MVLRDPPSFHEPSCVISLKQRKALRRVCLPVSVHLHHHCEVLQGRDPRALIPGPPCPAQIRQRHDPRRKEDIGDSPRTISKRDLVSHG